MMSEEDVSEHCPFCRGNCNCNACLHSSGIVKVIFLSPQSCMHVLLRFVWTFGNLSPIYLLNDAEYALNQNFHLFFLLINIL